MELIKLLKLLQEKFGKVIHEDYNGFVQIYLHKTEKDSQIKILLKKPIYSCCFNLFYKKETIVEYGEHQGFNKDSKPVVYHWVLKPFTTLANEIVSEIEKQNKLYNSMNEKQEKLEKEKEELEKSFFKEWRSVEENIEEEKQQKLNSLKEGELLIPEFKELMSEDNNGKI